jgi:hypothetical protein
MLSSAATAAAPDVRPQIAGWLEEAWVGVPGASLSAKLDTGADTSSLHAEDVRIERRDGRSIVLFVLTDRSGERRRIEAALVRHVSIRRSGARSDRRPVVSLPLCVAGTRGVTEFTLADRSGLDHPVLVGRSFLAGRIIVDPGAVHSADGRCDVPPMR